MFTPKPLRRTARACRAIALGLANLLGACDAGSDRIVASVGAHELTVDQLVELLARQNAVPNQPEIVEALANFWVDYALLAVAAQEDSLLTNVDLSPLLEPQLQQEVIDLFLQSTVSADTALTEEDLRALWDADPPADSVRARHILLTFPDQATQAQIDSVVNLAVQLKNRAATGESFEALARRYSEDPGSGSLGGDLGFFGPGAMVPAFEEATYALEVGEVSPPVGSEFGIHLIQLTDRKPTTFENAAESFRSFVVTQRVRGADSTYLADLDQEAEIEVAANAVTLLRELAARPQDALSARAAGRTVVDYQGGAYSAGDLREFLQTRPAEFAAQVQTASDADVTVLLQRLGQAQVLTARAAQAGIALTEGRQDTLLTQTRARITQATDALGIRLITALADETSDAALERTLLQIMRELVAGTRSAIPLGVVTVSLRRNEDWSISARSITATVARIAEVTGEEVDLQPQPAAAPAAVPSAEPVQDSLTN